MPTTVLVLCLAILSCSVLSAANGGVGTLIALRTLLVRLLLVVALASWIAATGATRFAVRAVIAIAVASAVVGVAAGVIFVQTGEVLSANNTLSEVSKSTPFGRMVRATGFTSTAQSLTHVLLIGVSLALFAPMRRLWRVLTVLIMIAGIGWTFTIGGYLVLLGVLAMWLLMRWPAKTLHLILATAGLGAVAYLAGWTRVMYEDIILSLGGKGTLDRMGTLIDALEAIRRHPWLGVGLRNSGRVATGVVHNAYLQFASEIGVPGALAFLGLVTFPVACLAAAVRGMPGDERRNWVKALLLASFTLVLHLSIEPFYDNYFSWAVLGMLAGAIGEMSVARSRQPSIVGTARTQALGGPR